MLPRCLRALCLAGAALLPVQAPAHPPQVHTVIIYSHADAAQAQRLRALARIWAPVWMDADLLPGAPWRPEIGRRICSAGVVLLLWSERAAQSVEVAAEWRQALACRRRVVPVVVDAAVLPGELQGVQWVWLAE